MILWTTGNTNYVYSVVTWALIVTINNSYFHAKLAHDLLLSLKRYS